jgi:hypothetical protein
MMAIDTMGGRGQEGNRGPRRIMASCGGSASGTGAACVASYELLITGSEARSKKQWTGPLGMSMSMSLALPKMRMQPMAYGLYM